MRSRPSAVAALVAGLLAGGVAVAAPAAAATPRNCPAKHVCLYDGANWSGSMKTVSCKPGEKFLRFGWGQRVTSVINGCSKKIEMRNKVVIYDPGPYPIIRKQSTVWAGQWANLGGDRQMDNRTNYVFVF